MTSAEIIDTLRELIVTAAPDPDQARPVRGCAEDEPLDHVIPFSSLIVLGVIVAVEDHFGIRVTRKLLAQAAEQQFTLRSLAGMIVRERAAGEAP